MLQKLMLSYIILIIGILSFVLAYFLPAQLDTMNRNLENKITWTAELLSEDEEIRTQTKNGVFSDALISRLDQLLKDGENIDFIVIAGTDSVRLYHPNHDEIGKDFQGGDQTEILTGSLPYITTREGATNAQKRAFHAITDDSGKIVGFIMVSSSLATIDKVRSGIILNCVLLFLAALAAGVLFSFFISRGIRKTLLGYEPDVFSKMYLQKEQILDNLAEGILAVNAESVPVYINPAARKMLGIKENSLPGSNGNSLQDSNRNSLPESNGYSLPESNGNSLPGSNGDSLQDSRKDFLQDSRKDFLQDSKKDFLHDSRKDFLHDSKENSPHNSEKDSSHADKENPLPDNLEYSLKEETLRSWVENCLADKKERTEEFLENGDISLIVNIYPLHRGEKTTGALLVLRDRTESVRLAEQLTGTNHVIEALRANTHEFKNELHILSGLLQLGEIDQAKNMLEGIGGSENSGSVILNQIENKTIAALLLGKQNRAKELDIEFTLRKDSRLPAHNPFLHTKEEITVIGNLIENAFEAMPENAPIRQIGVFISCDENGLTISVDDTGSGMTQEQIQKIRSGSYSTKGEGHGFGLKMIQDIVRRKNGFLEIESEPGEGTSFTVSIRNENPVIKAES